MNDAAARTYVEALVSGLSILTAETPADATYRLGLMALINGGDPTPEQSAELARRRTPEGAYPVPFDLTDADWAAIYPEDVA